MWWNFKSYSNTNRGYTTCKDKAEAMGFIENIKCLTGKEYFHYRHVEMVSQDTYQITQFVDLSVYD